MDIGDSIFVVDEEIGLSCGGFFVDEFIFFKMIKVVSKGKLMIPYGTFKILGGHRLVLFEKVFMNKFTKKKDGYNI